MRLLYRPGWRLRCVDPPIGWLQLREGHPPSVAIRLQLTCYLTSRLARSVWLQDAQLRVRSGQRAFLVPMGPVTDVDGEPFGREVGFDVYHDEPEHAFVEFVTDAPDLVSLLAEPGPAVAVDIEALLNDAIEYRKIADLELARDEALYPSADWHRFDTGRADAK